jgi:hypothetical protein
MAQKPKFKVVYDGNKVVVTDGADVHVEFPVAPPTIVDNKITERWWKRWSSEITIGIIAGLIVAGILALLHVG